MEAKHTPGPWTSGGWSSCGTPVLARDPRKNISRTIATVPCDYSKGIPGATGNESADYETHTTQANAHLIAAAPELLEAVRYALQYTIANGDAHDRLRAAIAKATGQSR